MNEKNDTLLNKLLMESLSKVTATNGKYELVCFQIKGYTVLS